MGLDSLVREPKLWLVLLPLNGHMSDAHAGSPLFSELIVRNLSSCPTPHSSLGKRGKHKDNLSSPVSVAPDRREEDHFCL